MLYLTIILSVIVVVETIVIIRFISTYNYLLAKVDLLTEFILFILSSDADAERFIKELGYVKAPI